MAAGDPGDFDAAVVTTRDGIEYLVRVARNASAEREQGGDLVALSAFTAGVRARLPFDVPTMVGQTAVDGNRAVVYTAVSGSPLSDASVSGAAARTAARAIAAIHELPTGFVGEAGLPALDADGVRDEVVSVVTRASATGSLPAALRERWLGAADDEAMWRLRPAVVNGQLAAESLITDAGTIVAVVGWSGLSVGDPARDLAWLIGSHPDAASEALDAYAQARAIAVDPQLEKRALLHAELELARWLLHGHELHDQQIVADAIGLLDGLVERVHYDELDPLRASAEPVLDVAGVESLLDTTRGAAVDSSGDAASSLTGHNPGLQPIIDEDVHDRAVESDFAHTPPVDELAADAHSWSSSDSE